MDTAKQNGAADDAEPTAKELADAEADDTDADEDEGDD